MKAKRQAKILDIIRSEPVGTQEKLLDRLTESGFRVTQATISRDIREMRLIKAMDANGSYSYIAVRKDDSDIALKFDAMFSELALHVDYAGNIVIVKCLSGMAMSTCAAIDSLRRDDIAGTVAGDDTFLCIVKNEETAAGLTDELKKMLLSRG